MTRHRYPTSSLLGDYARAGMGLAVTAGPVALAPASLWVTGGFGALALMFALFAGATALRQVSAVAVDEHGITVDGPIPMRLEWRALDRLSLRYFALGRDRA